MDALLNVLPNLSIGVVSIGGLVYVVAAFLKALDARADKHDAALKERESRLRNVEEQVRVTLTEHITQAAVALRENAAIMNQNTRVLERVVRKLDGERTEV
jgi:hypothetical protein